MIITFETRSGSVYEADTEAKQIRRLHGRRLPSARQGVDGAWRTYASISEIVPGDVVVIGWPRETTPLLPGSPECATPTTITSRVVRAAVRHERGT